MSNKLKFAIIATWIILIYGLDIFFRNILTQAFPHVSTSTLSFFSILGAISLTAFFLDKALKKFVLKQKPLKQKKQTYEPKNANELFIIYLNEWNIYNLKLFENLNPYPFLAHQKIEWILPHTNFSLEEQTQLLKRVKMTDQKLYMIEDDVKLKKIFLEKLEKMFEEKKIDYAVLLPNKESFKKSLPTERYEILETRDLLETLLTHLKKLITPAKFKKLQKELSFEDNILKEATHFKFSLEIPTIEIKMRPKHFWWWHKAQQTT
ncbi:hypothetical protein KAI58_04505 [Candidatus Gracilibacteria bacterium]|nr:hypothetical protein [Candidatus Gracilibacteria bacterium]